MIYQATKHLFALTALLLVVSGMALAQNGAVKGKVTFRTTESEQPKPLEGAIIDIYRLDIVQKFQTKTDKKGEYFHSLPAFGEYIMCASAPNASPTPSQKFKIGGDQPVENNFDLGPGDGSKLTLEQLKDYAKNNGAPPANAEEQKKRAEEAAKLTAERERINKENEKNKQLYTEVKKHFDAGLALAQKQPPDYDGAIKEYKEAASLDDSQPTIYANLSQALYNLGAVRFNNKQKDEALDAFRQSADYGEKATKMDPTNAANLRIYGDSCKILFIQFHVGDFADKAIAAYNSSSDLELDKNKKVDLYNKVGEIYFNMGDVDKSMATYEKALTADPDNLPALSGKALVLAASGEKPKMEQAITIFQQVIDKAPANSKLKTEAQNNIDYLAATLKIEVGKKDSGKKKDDSKKKKN
jgi:tetratricopeptide (TPR) repeat protein